MSKYDENTMAIDLSNGYFDLVVKSNEDGYYHSIIYSLPCTYRTININGNLYQDDRFVTITSNTPVCKELSRESLDLAIITTVNFISKKGKMLDILDDDVYLNDFINRNDNCEYIKDVNILSFDGQINLEDEVMQKLCIEKPVRKACNLLNKHGINTFMSSANKYNVESKDKPVDLDKLYIGNCDPWVIGNGYAWIMLDWNKLNDTNKHFFINEVNNNSDFIKLYEYIHMPKETASQYDFDHKKIFDTLKIKYQTDEKDYDDKKIIILGEISLSNYATKMKDNRFKTAVIRYPVDENTKVKDVEEFFVNFIRVIIKNNSERQITLLPTENTTENVDGEGKKLIKNK